MPTLPRGVGAGPSGHRYEHLRAVADSAAGSHAVIELCMLLAGGGNQEVEEGGWDRTMSAVRLSALFKDAERVATRPVACGESERRAVGSAMIATARARIEEVLHSSTSSTRLTEVATEVVTDVAEDE